MARPTKRPGETELVRDANRNQLPIMAWGTVHNLAPEVAAPDRNSTPISEDCGVVSIIAIGGPVRFRQGDSAVVATTSDPYLPEGFWHELPVFEGSEWDHVSVVAVAGTPTVQLVERI